MKHYRIFVIPGQAGDHFIQAETNTLGQAVSTIKRMAEASFDDTPAFPSGDAIVAVDRAGRVAHSWSDLGEEAAIDLAGRCAFDVKGKPVGWQLISDNGYNVHGEAEDPFGLMSFEILVDEAAETAREWTAPDSGVSLAPVIDGDIEMPTFVSTLGRTASPTL